MRIKLSVPGHYPEADLRQFLDSRISGTNFVLNASESGVFDAWFIFEETLPEDNKALVPRNRVFFLGAETARPLGFYYSEPGWLDYLAQFQAVYSPQELYTDHAHLTFPFLPWMVNANHGPELFAAASRGISFFQGLRTVEKTREISVFCSTKTLTPGHRVRLEFVKRLKNHFGDSLDWFGNGVNSVEEKWDGLAPYKYSLVLENQSTSYVLTEKIQDAFLSLSMPDRKSVV